jgi:hypothetical protein
MYSLCWPYSGRAKPPPVSKMDPEPRSLIFGATACAATRAPPMLTAKPLTNVLCGSAERRLAHGGSAVVKHIAQPVTASSQSTTPPLRLRDL